MNIRKPIDYSAMYTGLDQALERNLPQMELYLEIGKLVSAERKKERQWRQQSILWSSAVTGTDKELVRSFSHVQ